MRLSNRPAAAQARREKFCALRREGMDRYEAAGRVGVFGPDNVARYERWFRAAESGQAIVVGRPARSRVPLLRERKDGYEQEWYCEPPPPGAVFRVHPGGDEWDHPARREPVRRIYRIEICDAAEEENPAAGSPAERPGHAGPGACPGVPSGGTGRARETEALPARDDRAGRHG